MLDTGKALPEDNFSKIKPRMTDNEAVIEASRCLFCHDAPCTIACPSDIDIPLFIRQIMSRNPKGAARTIFTQNILGRSCAYVCPTEVLCEGACVYHGLNEKPIDIGRLQGYASDYAIDNDIRFFEKGPSSGKKVAVIGSGPAGLACAHELTRLGHEAVVFEASEKAGGLNAYGVAPYKYTNAEASEEVDYVSRIGFKIHTGQRIIINNGKSPKNGIDLDELEKDFDAVFLAVGLGKSKRLGIPGEDKKNVIGAAEFIYTLREQEQQVTVGKQVIVVGAGNTAIDACVECAKLGAKVTLIYRRSKNEQSAYGFEVDLAKQHGVRFRYLTSPVEILGSGRVEGIRCIQNKLTDMDSKGKPGIRPVPNSEFTLDCDMVILATGQEKQVDFYKGIPGLELEMGRVKIGLNYQTTNPKYFSGGDCVNGGKEVVNAVAHGRDAARGIDQYLMGEKH